MNGRNHSDSQYPSLFGQLWTSKAYAMKFIAPLIIQPCAPLPGITLINASTSSSRLWRQDWPDIS